ncbi:uracil-DNA glycosylase family protein [Streptococcus halichoeri]|uniref:uracil-DNA glycosylase family protein n=1 Tax=Streptococcus halichoeri TaxID=254785 RepID=UPI000DB3ECEB|nr:uracil-DNA glycosylase family protein [Streptococcus halichoeri]PZO95093.1 MAG: uracil-DNA glycosylase [Streptococcus pyogenes]
MDTIKEQIMKDAQNQTYTQRGIEPLYANPSTARIIIVGQAPGIIAQESQIYWNDRSGDRLRAWLGVDRELFYQSGLFGVLPMDFYYPGKGNSGDLPPRKGFAQRWHPLITATMPQVSLTILVGSYAQAFYLKDRAYKTLTETVSHYQEYLPTYFPLVHPSPRNFRWHVKNPWFEAGVVPDLQKRVAALLQT